MSGWVGGWMDGWIDGRVARVRLTERKGQVKTGTYGYHTVLTSHECTGNTPLPLFLVNVGRFVKPADGCLRPIKKEINALESSSPHYRIALISRLALLHGTVRSISQIRRTYSISMDSSGISDDNREISITIGSLLYVVGPCACYSELTEKM